MSLTRIVSVRLVSSQQLCDIMIRDMSEELKRKGWTLAKQPSFSKSRKNPDDVLVYMEFIEPDSKYQ